MIHTDEDDEFERIQRENEMKGQPYHYDVFVSVSQRNQVLEEAAKVADWCIQNHLEQHIPDYIRKLKK
jgi:hypothetical protein